MANEFLSRPAAAQLNRNIILRYIKREGRVSRTDIWHYMNISRASVTQIVHYLEESSLVVETGEKGYSGKRMSRYLRFNNNSRYIYVFDWYTHLLCLTNAGGEVIHKSSVVFPADCTPNAFANTILSEIEVLSEKYPINEEALLGLGIVLPGIIDSRKNTLLYSVELGWRDVNIQELFENRLEMALFLERTTNMVARGECEFGVGKGCEHLMVIQLSNEGIGLSTVVHENCQHGGNYMYGELGHIKLPVPIICSCGQKGCLEAIIRNCLLLNNGVIDDEIIEYISYGVSTAINIVDPSIVLLSGNLVRGLSTEMETLLFTSIRKRITSDRTRECIIKVYQDETLMAIKGMSTYVFDCCFPD